MDSIDPELMYCPDCGDEYRTEIVQCAACCTELIQGSVVLKKMAAKKDNKGRFAEITAGDTLITVQAGSLADMKKLKRLFDKEYIPSLLASENPCGSGCCGPKVMLQVRSQDVEEALAVIATEHAVTTALHSDELLAASAIYDASAAKVRCPACGHSFTPDGPDCPECGLCFS